jgi:hypothetical protein
VPPLACAIADNADASNSACRFLQIMACGLLILSVALLLWHGRQSHRLQEQAEAPASSVS